MKNVKTRQHQIITRKKGNSEKNGILLNLCKLCKKIINVIKENVGKMWKTRRYKRKLKKKKHFVLNLLLINMWKRCKILIFVEIKENSE